MHKMKRGTEHKLLGSANGSKAALPPKVKEEIVAHILISLECLWITIIPTDVMRFANNILEANPHLYIEPRVSGKKWYNALTEEHRINTLRHLH
jgi:hypothetical protein